MPASVFIVLQFAAVQSIVPQSIVGAFWPENGPDVLLHCSPKLAATASISVPVSITEESSEHFKPFALHVAVQLFRESKSVRYQLPS
jgi:hypothetical protein